MARRAPRCMLIVSCDDVAARARAIQAALAAGVDAIQLREPRGQGRVIYNAATRLRDWTRATNAALLVNDRLDVARAIEADGVHLPGASFPIAVARAVLGPGPWIGCSTHSAQEALGAAHAGADYVILGPIYDTPSKRAYGTPLGPGVLRGIMLPVPLIAIGGIAAENLGEVVAAGADGIAVIREILHAEDPAAAAARLVDAVSRAATTPSSRR